MSLKKAIDCIKKYNNFLITSHTNLEGDALGSELAFYLLLRKLGKSAFIVNEDDVPYEYDFLPKKSNIKKFSRFSRLWRDPAMAGSGVPPYLKSVAGKGKLKKPINFDCFVTLDCSDLNRTGEVYRINSAHKPVLNIDHHISNHRFGDVNWVDLNSSSCSEMIYKLYKKLGVALDKDAALLLYVGILTDTGAFRYSNTTSFTLKAVSQLLKYNLDVPQIFKNIYENITFQDTQLLARILSGMRSCAEGKIAWLKIKRNILKKRKLSFDLSETLLSFARAIKGVEVCVLFKENLGTKDEVRVNFRSQANVDVNRIAQFFGGGGHKTASAATIKGNIDQIIRRVLAKIRDSLK